MSDEVNVTERMLDTLEKIDDSVRETQVDIAKIKVDLSYHIKRSDLNEESINLVRQESNARLTKLEKWSDKFHFLGWLVAGAVSIAEVSIRVFDYFKH